MRKLKIHVNELSKTLASPRAASIPVSTCPTRAVSTIPVKGSSKDDRIDGIENRKTVFKLIILFSK